MNKGVLIAGVLGVLASMSVATSASAGIIWTFELPSTATNSQSPPYPSLGTLTLEQAGNDVTFLLDPNELNPGYTAGTNIKELDFVYKGRVLTDDNASDFGNVLGAGISTFDYLTNQNNFDSGYKADDQHITVIFSNGFTVNQTSGWTIFNTILTDFSETFATSNSKPSPTSAVISIAPFSNPNQTPNPSNWVTGSASASIPVPAPGTLGLLSIGLAAVALGRRRGLTAC